MQVLAAVAIHPPPVPVVADAADVFHVLSFHLLNSGCAEEVAYLELCLFHPTAASCRHQTYSSRHGFPMETATEFLYIGLFCLRKLICFVVQVENLAPGHNGRCKMTLVSSLSMVAP